MRSLCDWCGTPFWLVFIFLFKPRILNANRYKRFILIDIVFLSSAIGYFFFQQLLLFSYVFFNIYVSSTNSNQYLITSFNLNLNPLGSKFIHTFIFSNKLIIDEFLIRIIIDKISHLDINCIAFLSNVQDSLFIFSLIIRLWSFQVFIIELSLHFSIIMWIFKLKITFDLFFFSTVVLLGI